MTNDIITAIDQLYALRPAAAALANRLDDGRHVDEAEIAALYDAERTAQQALVAAITAASFLATRVAKKDDQRELRELDDACGLIASALSGVGDLSARWEASPAAHEAQIARTVEHLLAAGHDPDEIAAIIAADRADADS